MDNDQSNKGGSSPKSIVSESNPDDDLPLEEKIVKAEALKKDGNGKLTEGDSGGALEKYEQGLKFLEKHVEEDSTQAFVSEVYLPLRLNGAMAALKTDDPGKCKAHCNKVLLIDANNVKALYRRAMAHRDLSDFDEAQHDFMQVISIQPQNKEARSELMAVKQVKKEFARQQKEQFQRAFQVSLYDDQHKKFEQLQKEYEMYVETCTAENEAAEKEEDKKEVKSFKNWQDEQRQRAEEEQRTAKEKASLASPPPAPSDRQAKTEVLRCDSADLDADEQKILSEVKGKGYYHGRLGTVPSNDAPKPQLATAATDTPASEEKKGGSAWNQSGTTWEEKNSTDMATELFKKALKGVQTPVSPSGDESAGSVKISSVSVKDCHSSIATIRGTARYLFDITSSVKFKRELNGKVEDLRSFTLEITDATKIDEITCTIDACPDINAAAVKIIREGCHEFVDKYRARF